MPLRESYGYASAVTPHDSNVISGGECKALYVGGAGALTVITEGGQTVTFAAVPAGTIIPLRCTVVKATGTAATSIVALD